MVREVDYKYPKGAIQMRTYPREIIIDAINKSILHWKLNAEDVENATIGTSTCSLCQLYYRQPHTCEGCPVAQVSGDIQCRNTPYLKYITSDIADARQIALEEVAFLEGLLNIEHFNSECE